MFGLHHPPPLSAWEAARQRRSAQARGTSFALSVGITAAMLGLILAISGPREGDIDAAYTRLATFDLGTIVGASSPESAEDDSGPGSAPPLRGARGQAAAPEAPRELAALARSGPDLPAPEPAPEPAASSAVALVADPAPAGGAEDVRTLAALAPQGPGGSGSGTGSGPGDSVGAGSGGSARGSGRGKGGAGDGDAVRVVTWAPDMDFSRDNRHYPSAARAAGIEGVAWLKCFVQRGDRVRDCHVIGESPAGHGFGAAALKTEGNLRIRVHDGRGRRVYDEWIVVTSTFDLANVRIRKRRNDIAEADSAPAAPAAALP